MTLERRAFKFKFSSTNPRDVELARMMQADLDTRDVNLSEIAKALLYQWYQSREMLGYAPTPDRLLSGHVAMPLAQLPAPEPKRADPDDPAIKKMLGLAKKFNNFG